MIEAKGTNGRVTFDGVLVTIHRGGARSYLRGTGIRSIPARAIAYVDLKPAGLGRGWIHFGVDPDEDEATAPDPDFDDFDEDEDGEEGDDIGSLLGWGSRRRRRAAAAADDFVPAKDPNTVMFARGHQGEFEDIRREVKTAMWEATRRRPRRREAERQADRYGGDYVYDEDEDDFPPTYHVLPEGSAAVRDLRKLAQLLHEGVLSRAEFERAKARLMDRI